VVRLIDVTAINASDFTPLLYPSLKHAALKPNAAHTAKSIALGIFRPAESTNHEVNDSVCETLFFFRAITGEMRAAV
jgi:hypothetical protein